MLYGLHCLHSSGYLDSTSRSRLDLNEDLLFPSVAELVTYEWMISSSSTSKKSKLTHKLLTIFVILIIVAGFAYSESKKRFMGASLSHNMSPPVKVQPKEKATASLIFLHGLGDTGHGWAEQFRELSFRHIRCIFPHAPQKPVTLNGGMVMPSWFDIRGLDPSSSEDDQGIKDSSKELQQLIAKEISDGIPAERIIIGGFSQGGAVALYTAFGTDIKIGGVVALSTWLPMNKYFTNPANTKYNSSVPVLQCHGTSDPIVSFRWGHATHDIIKTFNPAAQFKSYSNMGHSSNPSEMDDVKRFLQDIVKDS